VGLSVAACAAMPVQRIKAAMIVAAILFDLIF